MRGPMQCPDCGMPRSFVGFEAHGDLPRDAVRLFVCRDCHVMEKVLVDARGMKVLERRDEVIPPEKIHRKIQRIFAEPA